jgi:putative peptide zinc metalloprotease protein
LTTVDGTTPVGAAAERRLGSDAPLQATFPEGQALPSEDDPQLAMVLVPSDGADSGDSEAPPAVDGSDEPWVFPFDKPLPPSEGDNQAAAFNTTDGSMVYDVAFALVWAEGDEVLNVNEAHAYASCSSCVTVAVAFQVVLIMDDAQVVVPQNLAVAANYQCYRCITAALASQLVLSVQDTPGEEELLALAAVWNRLAEFGQAITTYPLAEISAQLEEFKRKIVAILGEAPLVEATTAPQPSPDGSSTSPSTDTSTAPSTGTSTDTSTAPSTTTTTDGTSEPATSPSEPPASSSEPTSPEPTSEPTTESATTPPAAEPTPAESTSPSPTP